MNTQGATKQLFQGLGKRKVVGCFNGGSITSDAGALLLGEIDRARNRLETYGGGKGRNWKYKKISYSEQELDQFFVDVPEVQIVLRGDSGV